ncbi:hypothetical protein [Ralstonia sp. ASV6]|uniref:hypothetical protein n=1 Tax=Ralstonia sp. ASV6 TaxID=2795124 RepID=UPI0018EAC945|nr:hypothetical protein [Ralstonia sp. ASV6]
MIERGEQCGDTFDATFDTYHWREHSSDIQAILYRPRIRAFMRDVVDPALTALDADIARWSDNQEGGWMFARADAEALLHATVQAFCLSIQSLWERQLRNWLCACIAVGPRRSQQLSTARHDGLIGLSALLAELRGIPLSAFPSWGDLDLLQRVGNACRHGDGRSAAELFRSNPELWPTWSSAPDRWFAQGSPTAPPSPPSFEQAVLPRELLVQFANGIVGFWEDVEYLRLKGIKRKDERILQAMAELRAARVVRCS